MFANERHRLGSEFGIFIRSQMTSDLGNFLLRTKSFVIAWTDGVANQSLYSGFVFGSTHSVMLRNHLNSTAVLRFLLMALGVWLYLSRKCLKVVKTIFCRSKERIEMGIDSRRVVGSEEIGIMNLSMSELRILRNNTPSWTKRPSNFSMTGKYRICVIRFPFRTAS